MDQPSAAATFTKPSTASILLGEEISRYASFEIRAMFARKRKRPPDARALVRQSAIMAAAAKDARLKKRTLTNLYNERPTWLKLAHQQLDRAVLAAYAAVDPKGEWAEDWADVWVDSGAGQPLPPEHPLHARRQEIDQRVLANLLRINHQRAGVSDTSSERAKSAKISR